MSTDNTESNSEFVTQEELDQIRVEFNATRRTDVDDPDIDIEQLTKGKRPEIIKEAIQDPKVLDRLMVGGVDGALDPVPKADDSDEGDSDFVDQDDIDALIAKQIADLKADDEVPLDRSFFEGERPVIELEELEEPELLNKLLGETLENPASLRQDDTDSLIAELGEKDAQEDESKFGQDDIDTLLLGTASETKADEGPATQDADDALIADAVGDDTPANAGPASQDDIDALLLGGDSGDAASEPAIVDDAPVSQDDIDALLLGASGADEPDATPDAEHLESLIEAELKTLSSEDEESLLKAGESHEILDSVDMEDRLDAAAEQSLTSKFDDQLDADMAVIADDTPITAESVPPEEVSPETLQEVGGENIVAAADMDSSEVEEEEAYAGDDVMDEVAAPAPVDDLLEEDEDYVRPNFKRRQWLHELAKVPPVVVQMVKDQPYRALTGMAAGVIAMITAFLIMSANEYRPVSEYASIVLDEGSHLRRAMTSAEILIEDREYAEAAATLEKALLDANPKSPLYLDAEYIQLEAEMKMQAATVSPRTANRLHSKIDRIVTESPLHPKRPEALFWKGQLYAKEGNLQAARVEYRELLRNESQADNLHRVLLALGELELKTNRPVNAAEYLQELRRSYPGTAEAARGRLLLGDALVAAGDPESARVTYINVAENDPGGQLGADAFSRLGELALDSGEYEMAIRELEGRLSRSSTVDGNDGVTLLLGKAYRAVGRYEDAKNLLQGLIDFFPASEITPLARIELSQVMNDLGLGREAVRYATQTTQIYPDNQEVLRNAGELLALHGDALDAARALIAAHSAGVGDPELLLSAGRLFLKSGSKDRAEQVFRQLSEDYARTRQGLLGHIELAKILYDKGNVSEALERLETLSKTANSSARKLPVLAALGEMYGKMGLNSKVAQVYGEAAALSDEPDVVAESVVALVNSGSRDEALMLAQNVDVQQLESTLAYDYLNAVGRATMLKDAREGLGYLEQAHASYPDSRTADGVQRLLEANLSLNRSARARAILAELDTRVAERENAFERPRLERAAITYGNFLFDRGDYRAAADAYALALDSQIVGTTDDVPDMALSEQQLWSLFQLANAKFKLSEFGDSIRLYERVAGSSSEWAEEASTKLESARLEQRLRGRARTEARNAG